MIHLLDSKENIALFAAKKERKCGIINGKSSSKISQTTNLNTLQTSKIYE
jgi:hypothetical protein